MGVVCVVGLVGVVVSPPPLTGAQDEDEDEDAARRRASSEVCKVPRAVGRGARPKEELSTTSYYRWLVSGLLSVRSWRHRRPFTPRLQSHRPPLPAGGLGRLRCEAAVQELPRRGCAQRRGGAQNAQGMHFTSALVFYSKIYRTILYCTTTILRRRGGAQAPQGLLLCKHNECIIVYCVEPRAPHTPHTPPTPHTQERACEH